MEPQTWVQVLVLSCMNCVIVSESLSTLSLGFLYLLRGGLASIHSLTDIYRAPTGGLPWRTQSRGKAAVRVPVVREEV
jgi:hypothetical protein